MTKHFMNHKAENMSHVKLQDIKHSLYYWGQQFEGGRLVSTCTSTGKENLKLLSYLS